MSAFSKARLIAAAVTMSLLALSGRQTLAEDAAATTAKPTFAPDGTVHVPAFDLPPSQLMSKEAAGMMMMRAQSKTKAPSPSTDIATARAEMEQTLAPVVALMKTRYPVDIATQRFAGVPTRIITPKNSAFDPDRVLINLHGGGFSLCAEGCALLESIPIASVGKFKVVSVDYRMAPEARHPAAVEDVAAVYAELLKSYRPKKIGIYGCSAGGAITAEAAAWFSAHNLPEPGAIGIFGAGAVPFGIGDSAYVTGYTDGSFAPPTKPGQPADMSIMRGYFAGADMKDPIISPAYHPDVLAKFPPTLVITGSRAMDMSPATYTNSELLKAGVSSTLIVGEALGHCYIYFPTPESLDAYRLVANFFKTNLH